MTTAKIADIRYYQSMSYRFTLPTPMHLLFWLITTVLCSAPLAGYRLSNEQVRLSVFLTIPDILNVFTLGDSAWQLDNNGFSSLTHAVCIKTSMQEGVHVSAIMQEKQTDVSSSQSQVTPADETLNVFYRPNIQRKNAIKLAIQTYRNGAIVNEGLPLVNIASPSGNSTMCQDGVMAYFDLLFNQIAIDDAFEGTITLLFANL